MKPNILHFLVLLIFGPGTLAQANDGVFYTSGNQLVPYEETEIEVRKEVLQFIRKNDDITLVKVRYELYNPGEEKSLTVGFEAPPPSGDFSYIELKESGSEHPYMYEFQVIVNGQNLSYRNAIVHDSAVDSGHQLSAIRRGDSGPLDSDILDLSFTYVYYFSADFKPGMNIIEHTYEYKTGGTVMEHYYMTYSLEPITRWANGQVDEFILELDLGPYQEIGIDGLDEYKYHWDFDGNIGTYLLGDQEYYFNGELFFTRSGKMTLRIDSFKPRDPLYIFAPLFMDCMMDQVFDAETKNLSYSNYCSYDSAVDERSFRILRNLPYARRGYVFQTDFIQLYYETMPWYKPNKEAGSPVISEEELEWIETLDSIWGW